MATTQQTKQQEKAPDKASEKPKDVNTALAKAYDTFLPMIERQIEGHGIQMSAYSKQCVLNAISAINALLSKEGSNFGDSSLDMSSLTNILMFVAGFQLNASASPREIYFIIRKQRQGDNWKKIIELGVEGDGNDAILARFGRDIKKINQIWKVRENDVFEYPEYNGLDMDPPKWKPKGSGKIVRVVYPIIKNDNIIEFYIAEREDVITNLLAHINNNLMNETFGVYDGSWSNGRPVHTPTEAEKAEVKKKKREILNKVSAMGLDAAIDCGEFDEWISPAWREPHSKEAMIERKMRNNAIKKIPKNFSNGALETMFDEMSDENYRNVNREITEKANKTPLKIDHCTGEVMNDQPMTDQDKSSAPEPVSANPAVDDLP